MDDNCKDCVYVLNIKQDVTELKVDIKEVDRRVGDMEAGAEGRKEQMKNMVSSINEIKGDVKEIKNSKSKFLSGIASGVAIAIIVAFLLQSFKLFHW